MGQSQGLFNDYSHKETMIKVRTLGFFVSNLTKDTAVIKNCQEKFSDFVANPKCFT